MIIFGIDPGVSGAICVFESSQGKRQGRVVDVHEIPTMIDGKKNKRQVNGTEVANIFRKELDNAGVLPLYYDQLVKVVVEHVTAMPGQGVTSMFNFGQSFGVIKGICGALKIPIYFVRPAKWKKHFNLIKTNKDASRTKVIEIYPKISSKLSRKKDSNKADAILIARYFSDTQL